MLSDRLHNRFWFYVYPIIISAVGCFVFMFTSDFGPKYFSLFLLNFGFCSFGTIFAWNSNTINRPPAKRTVGMLSLEQLFLSCPKHSRSQNNVLTDAISKLWLQ